MHQAHCWIPGEVTFSILNSNNVLVSCKKHIDKQLGNPKVELISEHSNVGYLFWNPHNSFEMSYNFTNEHLSNIMVHIVSLLLTDILINHNINYQLYHIWLRA